MWGATCSTRCAPRGPRRSRVTARRAVGRSPTPRSGPRSTRSTSSIAPTDSTAPPDVVESVGAMEEVDRVDRGPLRGVGDLPTARLAVTRDRRGPRGAHLVEQVAPHIHRDLVFFGLEPVGAGDPA